MGSAGIPPLFLTSALGGGEWSDSRPGRFITGDGHPGTHWIGGWVGPRASLNSVSREKYPLLAGNRTPAVQPVTIPTELS
jgi:hypothetical protein